MKKKKRFYGGILLFVLAVSLFIYHQEGPFSITAHTSATTYPGDKITITWSDYITESCPNAFFEWFIEPADYDMSTTLPDRRGLFAENIGIVWSNQIKTAVTAWSVPDETKYAGKYTVIGRAVCGVAGDYISQTGFNGWSTYFFTVHERPPTITCTDDCSIAGIRDRTDGECPYRVCGNYDADSCLEWSEYKTDSTCNMPQPDIPPYVPPVVECKSDWKTGVWSECTSDGFQVRQVFDLNGCKNPTGVKPASMQSCTPPVPEPDCGTFEKVNETICIENLKIEYYENDCGEIQENPVACVSEVFFDEDTLIVIGVVVFFIVTIGFIAVKKR